MGKGDRRRAVLVVVLADWARFVDDLVDADLFGRHDREQQAEGARHHVN